MRRICTIVSLAKNYQCIRIVISVHTHLHSTMKCLQQGLGTVSNTVILVTNVTVITTIIASCIQTYC